MKWSAETRKIKDLVENPKNPRRLAKDQGDQLRSSIEKFGLCEPIVINPDGFVIGGHQRLKTMKKMGYKDAEVYVPERALDDAEIDELTIRLNKNVGEWDFEMLANQWDMQMLLATGFTSTELGIDIDLIPDKKQKEREPKKCPNCGHSLG
jgi:ParB-like chromosome segregation protein Spo0J